MDAEAIARARFHEFQRLCGQLRAAKAEIDALSGKSDDAPAQAVSEIKLRLIDQLLGRANQFLGEARPFDFAGFAAQSATHSDVALVLGQYISCFEALRARHLEHRHGKWFWLIEIEDEGGQKRTERVPVESFREPEKATAAPE